jgi:hypothetical protein
LTVVITELTFPRLSWCGSVKLGDAVLFRALGAFCVLRDSVLKIPCAMLT